MRIRLILLTWALLAFCEAGAAPPEKIQHIIVISLENHSFDNLLGNFPGAEGLAQAGPAATQTDNDGHPYAALPPIPDRQHRFPDNLPNAPFAIEPYAPASERTPDLVHRFYQEQEQIDGGRMDRFAAVSDAGGLTMGYYDASRTALWEYAKKYTLADHFFHAAFGGSFLNHFWLVCACTPRFDQAPAGLVAQLDARGRMIKDGAVTPDGYAVNTLMPFFTPHPAHGQQLPAQELPTIGDRLSEKGISWAWYAGGWNDAAAGHPPRSFQFHHQPFVYFKNFADGAPARAHLKDENDFLADLKAGTLPAVAFWKPLGEYSLHPGYADVTSGDAHLRDILQAIEASPVFASSVVIVTFDENGGYWDHVAPPVVDRFGPGVRVPTLIMSPFAKKGYVDHTVYDTTSILKFIEMRFGLAPLSARDAQASDLGQVLEK